MSKDVYSVIKERILSGAYKSGEFIKEQVVAEELNVSRTPIRESLARLEWEKLVTIIPRAGAMVAPAELTLVKEAYQVRYVLEGKLGRLAASRATEAHIEEVKEIRAELDTLVERGTQQDLTAISKRFRAVLGKAAGNATLFEMADQLFNISLRVWYSLGEGAKHSELALALASEIDDMLAALKVRDEDAAEAVMQDAITYYTEMLKASF